jgi:hypothetical protein
MVRRFRRRRPQPRALVTPPLPRGLTSSLTSSNCSADHHPLAVDTAGAMLAGQGQGPLEDLQITHQPGAALAIEVTAVELPES